MLMLISPTDIYRVLNLSLFERVSEAAGIASSCLLRGRPFGRS